MTADPIRAGNFATLTALITFGAAGVTTFLAMPILAAGIVNRLGRVDADAALFSTVQLIAVSIGCLLSIGLPVRNLRRFALICVGTIWVCDLLCLANLNWGIFLTVRAISGVAGGLAVSQATAAMSRLPKPERTFGLFLAWQTIVSILFAYLGGAVIERFGFGAVFAIAIALDVIALALSLAFLKVQRGGQGDAIAGTNDRVGWTQSILVLASILMFFTGIGAVWTFLALMAQRAGTAASGVATLITVSKLCAFFASFLPGLFGNRFGRTAPLMVAALCLIASTAGLSLAQSFLGFAIATALLSTAWYAYYPLQLSALSYCDKDGRPMLASAALTGIGLGIGPILVAAHPASGSLPTSVGLTAGPAFFLSGMLIYAALRIKADPQSSKI